MISLILFRELDLFQGLSFTTISSTGPNGGEIVLSLIHTYFDLLMFASQAIIHYSPDPNDCDIIKKDQIYLCDSGGGCFIWRNTR